MGWKEVSLKLPADYTEEELRRRLGEDLGIAEFSYSIENKSLDARKKNNIHWLLRITVVSDGISGPAPDMPPPLDIPRFKTDKTAVVVGSGPAGFFCAFVLQKAGVRTTILERGSEVGKRAAGIREFEATGAFNAMNNYAFGEGGAGTFSDGKLTSRTKNISRERQFMIAQYIQAGAPEETAYMAHPHLGSDNLRKIVRKLREEFLAIGGTILFETLLEDLTLEQGTVTGAVTRAGVIGADYFIIAPGHSAYETYRMLISRGVKFRAKDFAIGCRIEHPQEIINLGQWGLRSLAGVKAAEYRLASPGDGNLPVYTFCMCPGGSIIPATAYPHTNIVNGMSLYQRNGKFANAACVAGINLSRLLGREVAPAEALDWLEGLEESFYTFAGGYQAPFCSIRNFIDTTEQIQTVDSSYPLGLRPAALWELLPPTVSSALREGLKDFTRKIKGFDQGTIMGLESKTSSPVQVIQGQDNLCAGFSNLYLAGEGSGYAGGIISSGTNGIRTAMSIIGGGHA
ncbi:MAG: NAD(P)/FAD-dependent oxidoreductase [Thermodesulfovibrionales bacterium]